MHTRVCAHTACLCPPAVLADPRHAQALVGPLTSLPRGTLLQRGPSTVVFWDLSFSGFALTRGIFPFPSLLAVSSAAWGGTLAGGVVRTAGIHAAT